jgi:hypothetical protein
MAITNKDGGPSDLSSIFNQVISQAAPAAPAEAPPVEAPEVEVKVPKEPEIKESLGVEVEESDDAVIVEEDTETPNFKADLEKAKKDAENFQKGMRQFQKERDDLKKQFKVQQDAIKKFEAVEKAFKLKGIEGLVGTLSGKEDAWAEIQKRIEERAVRRYTADPSELELLDREDELLRERSAREAAEKEYQEHMAQISQREERAREAELTSKLNPTFDKYRFDGEMGDAEQEAELNEYVWKTSIKRLAAFRDSEGIEDHEIPLSVIEDTFKQVASRFNSVTDKKADEKVKAKLDQKKEEASKAAKGMVSKKRSPSTKTVDQAAEEYMKDYNIQGFFNSFFKK